MIKGLWGKKLGMTQIFTDNNRVEPVTAIDVSGWVITNIKTEERDGYNALQVGSIKKKHAGKTFSRDWLKKTKEMFSALREIRLDQIPEEVRVGAPLTSSVVAVGDVVDVFGVSKGCGFAGVMRRYDFSGGPRGHGHTMGRATGSLGFMASCGKVIKGKKMPGHMGNERCATKNLKVVKVEPEAEVVFVTGSVPGKAGSLVLMRKCG